MKPSTFAMLFIVFCVTRCFAQWPWHGHEWFDFERTPSWIAFGGMEREQEARRKELFVRTKTQYNCNSETGKKDKVGRYYYDRNGNLLRFELGDTMIFESYSYEYNWKNQLVCEHDTDMGRAAHHNYTYDAQGRRLTNSFLDKNRKVVSTTHYSYDPDGHLTKSTTKVGTGLTSTEEYSYSKSGRVISEVVYDEKRVVTVKKLYEYDANDFLVRYESYVGRDSAVLVEYYTYERDSSGALAEADLHRPNGKVSYHNYYRYDLSGRRMMYGTVSDYGSSETTFIYDERGLAIKETRNVNSSYYTLFTYEYYGADSPVVLKSVFFATGKSALLPESFSELDSLVIYLEEHAGASIAITGHTDNVGTEVANQKLSEDRAKAVADYLVSKGIDRARISFKGLGSAQPVVANDSKEGREKNRRVEFTIIDTQ